MSLRIIPVTIPSGSSMSNGVDCSGSVRIVRIIMPPDWTYAALTFQMSPDNVNYHDVYHTVPGTTDPLQTYLVSLASPAPNAVVAFPVNTGASVAWVKLRSGTTATPVKQAADRVFQIVVEDADVVAGGGGAAGPAGPTGPAGVAGPTGLAGSVGPTGSAGALGSQGAVGPAGPTGATGPGSVVQAATGPTGGYTQHGNIIDQWGTLVASTGAGTTVSFSKPYIDGPPIVGVSAAAGGTLQVSATKTSITVSCNSGSPTVSWRAIGT